MIGQLIRLVLSRGRLTKHSILIAYDVAAMAFALWAAFTTRLSRPYWPEHPHVLLIAAASIIVGVLALASMRIYDIVLRYFDLRIVTRILFASVITSVTWVVLIYLDGLAFVPRSVGAIYGGFLFLLLFVGRYVMAMLISEAGKSGDINPGHVTPIAIYGANGAGRDLANSIRTNARYRLCAFIDDDPAMWGRTVAGVGIRSPAELTRLVVRTGLTEVFLALPQATRSERLEAIQRLSNLHLTVKTIPSPEEIVSGRYTMTDIRPIDVSDLLRREPVEPLDNLIREAVAGRSILVTGAGGSIGSEICRQILGAQPHKLVIFDHSEFSLYAIDQQLSEMLAKTPPETAPRIVAVVGSLLNNALVRRVIAEHDIDTVYHAAAYKHVPMIEDNEVVGVENNVMGTMILARAAAEARITRFTMISTDKAVRPKSVMGASKRVAELFIQALANESATQTRFGIVRFGNVLDSSGSVVQRFRDQIRVGGPITVTHEDITRFFMSIPEATQLVLQASAMATQGEVFVLDMGEPVKISDLARNMIQLSGMTVRDETNVDGDIEIVFTGLRSGEKLYEELFVGEHTQPTAHPRIQMARERCLPMKDLMPEIDRLARAIATGDARTLRSLLGDLIAPDQGALETTGGRA